MRGETHATAYGQASPLNFRLAPLKVGKRFIKALSPPFRSCVATLNPFSRLGFSYRNRVAWCVSYFQGVRGLPREGRGSISGIALNVGVDETE